MKQIDANFEIKEMSDSGSFSGYGSVYGNTDEGDDIVAPGCFSQSLSDWTAKGRMPALLWQHNPKEPIGTYTKMTEDDNGLYVEGKLAIKTQKGLEAYELMKMKAISGLSVGFITRNDSYDQKTGVRTIKQGDLMEVSLVTFPMNDSARVATVKNVDEITDFKSAERFLRDSCNLSRSEATAFFTRVKSLAQRDSVTDEAANQIIQSLRHRMTLIQT